MRIFSNLRFGIIISKNIKEDRSSCLRNVVEKRMELKMKNVNYQVVFIEAMNGRTSPMQRNIVYRIWNLEYMGYISLRNIRISIVVQVYGVISII